MICKMRSLLENVIKRFKTKRQVLNMLASSLLFPPATMTNRCASSCSIQASSLPFLLLLHLPRPLLRPPLPSFHSSILVLGLHTSCFRLTLTSLLCPMSWAKALRVCALCKASGWIKWPKQRTSLRVVPILLFWSCSKATFWLVLWHY